MQPTGQVWPQAGHVLRNLAYGPTPALLADLADPSTGLTLEQWIAQQLDPQNVPEVHPELVGNPPNLYGITLPTAQGDQVPLSNVVMHQLLRATYSERQLLERLVWLWEQRFTTNASRLEQHFGDDATAAWLEHVENEGFRAGALGKFEDLLRLSATSPTMLVYLDSVKNEVTASGMASNENYGRELLELHALGYGENATDPQSDLTIYDAVDVAKVARVFTGWTVAKKLPQNVGDPGAPKLTPCEDTQFLNLGDVDGNGQINQGDVDAMNAMIAAGTYDGRFDIWPPGTFNCPTYSWGGDGVVDGNDLNALLASLGMQGWAWSFHFDTDKHDYAPKVLFDHGNPNLPKLTLPVFPSTPGGGGSPAAVQEGYILLDHLAASPYTARSVSTLLYEYFVADLQAGQEPPILDDMVTAWLASDGDLTTVSTVLFDTARDLGQEANYFDKVRTQMETVVAPIRAFGGDHPTSPSPMNRVRLWLQNEMGYYWFRYPSPEGFEEKGDQHVSMWKMLQWTRYNQHVWEPGQVPSGTPFPNFQYDVTGMLVAGGVNPVVPSEVVNYFSRLLYQCAFTPEDYQLCLEFLTTDDQGVAIQLSSLTAQQYEEHVRRFAAFVHSLPQGIQQ